MSRGGRGRTRTVRLTHDGDGSGALIALAAVVGLLAGGLGAPWAVAHTQGRALLDPDRYQVVVPGVKVTGASLAAVAKTGVADGQLVLETRAFGAPERLVPQASGVATMDVELAAGSDPVVVNARAADGMQVQVATLLPDGWLSANGEPRAYAEAHVAHFTFADGQALVDGVMAARAAGGGVELAPQGHAGIRRIRLADATGATLLADDFSPTATLPQRAGWAFFGAVAAAAAVAAGARTTWTGRLVLLVEAAFALFVLALPYGAWMAVVERLYLAQLDVGALRTFAFAAALVPLAASTLRASGLLDLERARAPELPGAAAAVAVAVASLLAARDLSGWGWALLPVGALAAWLPWRASRDLGQAPAAALLRDLPALLVPAVFGWGLGLLPAALWRLLCLSVDVPGFLRKGAQSGADALLVLLLVTPLGAETALRGTVLLHTWDPTVLAGASVGGTATVEVASAFWTDGCGAEPRARVYAFGGSSTGGAWQYRGQPGAFFPARLHAQLCAAGHAVETLNYGEGGRDSFDIAQAAPTLFAKAPPAVVVLYLGVNDLLTVDSPMTRKQRAALLTSRPEALGLVDRVSSGSRLITGLGLVVRPHAEAKMVAAVPLADAEENVRAIVAAAVAQGGRVVLVPELTRAAEAAEVQSYAEMLNRLGGQLPGTTVVDARAAIGPELDGLMTDRNHLSPEGGERLAAVLLPAVEAAL